MVELFLDECLDKLNNLYKSGDIEECFEYMHYQALVVYDPYLDEIVLKNLVNIYESTREKNMICGSVIVELNRLLQRKRLFDTPATA